MAELENRSLGPHRMPSVSICTPCMGRVHHLEETLPRNLADNADYPDLEFVLVDYASPDGFEAWAREELRGQLASGRIAYYRTGEPTSYSMSHALNMACRLARGDILCCVDADNFTGEGYARYVAEVFAGAQDVYLIADQERFAEHRDLFGRVCLRSRDFLAVGGYDEGLHDYGYCDLDLYTRLEHYGLRPAKIGDERYLGYIRHPDIERVAQGPLLQELFAVFDAQRTSWPAVYTLYLFHDGRLERLGLPLCDLPASGRWQEAGDGLRLRWQNGEEDTLRAEVRGRGFRGAGGFELRRVEDDPTLAARVLQYTIVHNERRHLANRERSYRVNPEGFGRGTVVRNFGETIALR